MKRDFILSFNDFQAVLKENQGKPIYEITGNGYNLYWSLQSFAYMTSISFNEILESYKKETGNALATLEQAKDTFQARYLQDCYQNREHLKKQLVSTLGETDSPVRVESKDGRDWNTVKSQIWTMLLREAYGLKIMLLERKPLKQLTKVMLLL